MRRTKTTSTQQVYLDGCQDNGEKSRRTEGRITDQMLASGSMIDILTSLGPQDGGEGAAGENGRHSNGSGASAAQ